MKNIISDMRIKKFIEDFTDGNKIKSKTLKEIKTEIYESMNPSVIDVYEDFSDYLLELTDKYDKVTSPYGDVRDIIDLGWLELNVALQGKYLGDEYTIATEKDSIWQRGQRIEIDPRDIPTSKKLSIYGSDFDEDFLRYYKKVGGKVEPYYAFLIGFDNDYQNGRRGGWTQEMISEMTEELIISVKRCLKRLSAKIVRLEAYDGNEWGLVRSNNLDEIKYPRFKVGFTV